MSSTMKLRVNVVTVEAPSTDSAAPTAQNPEHVAAIARAVLPTDREGFAVLHLDSRLRVRSIELVSIGTLDYTVVHPREVFKAAILQNAASIVLVHNHPSGDTTPSEEDQHLTDRIRKAGELLGIDVVDHVIIAGENHFSMARGR